MAHAMDNFPDEELARRARAGSPACFEEIARRYQAPLLRFLNRRFPSRRDGEDILQETFLKAWRSLHRFDDRYVFRTWLYTIAYRLAVSHGRQDAPEESLPPDARSSGPRPEAALLQADQRRTLWQQARLVLTDEQFTALWLHYVEEIPAGDVARILGRSWVSVKTLMHRARKKLMPFLIEKGFEPALAAAAAMPSVKAGEP